MTWEAFADILWDAFKDSLIVLPFLFAVYLLIEIIEQKLMFASRAKMLLRGKYAPLIGTGIGLIPQCGFSVMATNLYLSNNLTIGTLIAVFISTSDEAIPILIGGLVDSATVWKILPMLAIKVIYAIMVGYAVDFIFRKRNERKLNNDTMTPCAVTTTGESVGLSEDDHEDHDHDDDHDHDECHDVEIGCCHHKLEHGGKVTGKDFWKVYLLHPLVHSLKVFIYIFIINFAFGLLLYFVGEDKIGAFLESSGFWQPFVAGLVGLIPNCAASVIISQLYVLGGLRFGSCVAGLCVNAGISLALLFRKNKNVKDSLLIVGILYFASVILGVALTPIPW